MGVRTAPLPWSGERVSQNGFLHHTRSGRPPGRRQDWRVARQIQTLQDGTNHRWIGDERDQLPPSLTKRTLERLNLEGSCFILHLLQCLRWFYVFLPLHATLLASFLFGASHTSVGCNENISRSSMLSTALQWHISATFLPMVRLNRMNPLCQTPPERENDIAALLFPHHPVC